MASPSEYWFISTSFSFSLEEWKNIATIIGTLFAVPGVLFAAYKTFREVKGLAEQRERELRLKRAEFTLAQHHRLFDDKELFSVLKLVDSDHLDLRKEEMWDLKRKFLAFFEEIALLVNSDYMGRETAYYMLGYYAVRAHKGENFRHGINYVPAYWVVFFHFAQEAEAYLNSDQCKENPALQY